MINDSNTELERKTHSLAWLFLCLAILLEVAGITSMKLSQGFSKIQPSILIFLFYISSFAFLAQTLKYMEIGFAYAIWSALGTLLIVIIGICFFSEPITIYKALSLACIIIGVIGLRQ
jgi:small multidrug resistance pump